MAYPGKWIGVLLVRINVMPSGNFRVFLKKIEKILKKVFA
jgi:hypothetical protein